MEVDRRRFILGSAAGGALAAVGVAGPILAASPADAAQTQASSTGHILEATAITQVYGDGQKLIAVALEYDAEIDPSSLSTSTYEVSDRTVTAVYTSHTAAPATHSTGGRYVIVELSPDDSAALLWVTSQGTGAGGSGGGAGGGGGGVGPGGPTVGDNTPGGTILAASVSLTQSAAVTTTRHQSYAANGTVITNDAVINLIVDEFEQYTFDDPATGQTLSYNLFVPRGYDHRKSYPLVLFMHDASVVNVATIGPLVQGLGAVCWASPEDQARHECFVLAPEYPSVVIDDDYEPSTLFDATVNLVNSLSDQYSIDKKRRYATGQSMGAMLALGMNIEYPDLFGASFIVAGQWPSDQADPLARKKLWIVVSEDDTKAYPGENAIVEVIEGLGTSVTEAQWNAEDNQSEFAAAVRSMESQRTPVNYAHFEAGTVITAAGGGSGHMDTWIIAYTIPGIRDWIMRQSL